MKELIYLELRKADVVLVERRNGQHGGRTRDGVVHSHRLPLLNPCNVKSPLEYLIPPANTYKNTHWRTGCTGCTGFLGGRGVLAGFERHRAFVVLLGKRYESPRSAY